MLVYHWRIHFNHVVYFMDYEIRQNIYSVINSKMNCHRRSSRTLKSWYSCLFLVILDSQGIPGFESGQRYILYLQCRLKIKQKHILLFEVHEKLWVKLVNFVLILILRFKYILFFSMPFHFWRWAIMTSHKSPYCSKQTLTFSSV